jgi:hypothetical protein
MSDQPYVKYALAAAENICLFHTLCEMEKTAPGYHVVKERWLYANNKMDQAYKEAFPDDFICEKCGDHMTPVYMKTSERYCGCGHMVKE